MDAPARSAATTRCASDASAVKSRVSADSMRMRPREYSCSKKTFITRSSSIAQLSFFAV